ncbi:MAG: DinB family protein [Gemmatimonadaceae bacterium]
MPASLFARPAADEAASYYQRYLERVPAGDLLTILAEQQSHVDRVFRAVGPERASYAYAPGKWNVKEVLGHLIDTERVFTFRGLSFARGDTNPLPTFDQDRWLPYGEFNARSMDDLTDEWAATRQSTIALIRGLPDESLTRRGVASGYEFSARAALHVPPGHTTYHLEILRERYQVG